MTQAIIATGADQHQVKKGSTITINRLEGDVGATVAFDVLAVIKGEAITLGTPTVKNAKVTGKILSHERGDKVTVGKYKRRKGYHKKQGHRQDLTTVQIDELSV